MVSCNSPRLYHGDGKLLLEEMVSVTVHSYIMEMTSDFKKRWLAVTVHSYIMEVTSHFKKRWWAVTVHDYIMEMANYF